jgi:hypothetical protein
VAEIETDIVEDSLAGTEIEAEPEAEEVGLGDTDVDDVTDGVTDGDAHKYDECSETHCPIPPSLTGNDPALSHSTSPTCHSPIPDPTLAPCHPASQ